MDDLGFRWIATRYDKLAQTFMGIVKLACICSGSGD
jgi:hypothetical protein